MFSKRITYFFLISLIVLFLLPSATFAVIDPSNSPNNKYGIHIISENDLEKAAILVNSSGGDWGYVTIVITQQDRDPTKWQNIFDRMQQLHLIPIVRLATNLAGDVWETPRKEEADSWVEFLDSLNWVTKNRYVVIFNEPNHAKEWGGKVDPIEYAKILVSFSSVFKNRSSNFFILPAGLDASAPNSNITMDEIDFLRSMVNTKADFFSYIDGWTSHSYPNPGFAGSVEAEGRGTLRTYQWELRQLNFLGNSKKLPVFITETGWPHQEGTPYNRNFFSASEVAGLIEKAVTEVWNDSNIVAVTPFVLNYQSYPFANFSWQQFSKESFYPQYEAYRAIPKIVGKPIRNINYDIYLANLSLNLEINNNGQFNFLKQLPFQFAFFKKIFWPLEIPSFNYGQLVRAEGIY